MTTNAYAAYKSVQNTSGDTRDIEYRLLAQVTGALIYARDNKADYKARIDSAMWNRSVWAALREDLIDSNNKLPKTLRASLISVSIYIEKESFAVIDGIGDIDALIDINRNIMAGLKPDGSSADMTIASAASQQEIKA